MSEREFEKVALERDENGAVRTWIDQVDGQPHVVTVDPYGRRHVSPVPNEYMDRQRFSVEAAAGSALNYWKNVGRQAIQPFVPESYEAQFYDDYYQDRAAQVFRDEYYGYPSTTGKLAAILPYAYFGRKGGLGRQVGAAGVAGAFEEALPFNPEESLFDRALAGAATGVAGDVSGRLFFKSLNMAGKFARSLLQGAESTLPLNPVAEEVVNRGYKVTQPSDYMPDDAPGRQVMENLEVTAQTSAFAPSFFKQNRRYNQRLLASRLWDAFGLPSKGSFAQGDMLDVRKALNARQMELNPKLGEVEIPPDLMDYVGSLDEVRIGRKIGTFKDIDRYFKEKSAYEAAIAAGEDALPPAPVKLKGKELVDFRSQLTDAASEMGAANTARMGEIINSLDDEIMRQAGGKGVGQEVLEEYADLREQWQLYFALNSGSVFGKEGINLGRFNQRMGSAQGFGEEALFGDWEAFQNPAIARVVGDAQAIGALRNIDNYSNTGRSSIMQELTNPPAAAANAASSAGLSFLMREGHNPQGPLNAGIMGFNAEAPYWSGIMGRQGALADPEAFRDALFYPFVGDQNANEQP